MENITHIDFAILHFIKKYTKNKVLDKLMPFFSRIGDFGFIWICFVIILLFGTRFRKYVPFLLGALILSCLIGEMFLKHRFKRIRPCNIESVSLLIKRPYDFSFPSGHSMSSFTFATLLWSINHNIGGVALIFATFIALSRLYLFVHYPTDVIAGSLIGKLLGFTTYQLSILVYKHL